jgi:2-polyprenyl-3-methyl-5-hydroxy-6-metoxy-1,4-benzoquinol methylase
MFVSSKMKPTFNSKTIDDVRNFWDTNPLFAGESEFQIGSKEWFLEHEKIYIQDCFAGQPPDVIFTSGLTQDTKILDVGCGPGFWVRYFLRKGFFNISACDLSIRAVELTKASLKLFDLKEDIDIKQGNAENLPYEDDSFDHINCQGVIHHTPHPDVCIKEFYRIIRPHGSICLSVYHKHFMLRHPILLKLFTFMFRRFIKMKGRGRTKLLQSGEPEEIVRMYDGEDNPIGKAYTRQELEMMLRGMFKITEMGYFFFPARAISIKIPASLHRWLHRALGLMIVVQAVKK